MYAKYIHPIEDIFTWVLLQNHLHLLLRIKDKEEMSSMPINKTLSYDKTLGISPLPLTGSIKQCQDEPQVHYKILSEVKLLIG